MLNWKNVLYNITIATNCLLCFFLIFYDKLTVPIFLQVVGRAHPLFLHFPIVLFILFIGMVWLSQKNKTDVLYKNISQWLLLSTAFTAAITALMGLFISKEPGYNEESLQWHKWSGAAVSLLAILWYSFYDFISKGKIILASSSLASALVLLIAGHEGANITHGDGFLLAPIDKNQQPTKPTLGEAVVFTDMVKPIFNAKCVSCHNSNKAKGELVMESPALLLRGGKDGPLWDTADVNMSLIMQRLHLPLEEKKHMPPNGKPQLTDEEMAILYNWIKGGADFKVKVVDLAPTDTLRSIAGNLFKASGEEEHYDFAAASEKTIQELNSNFRTVYPIATGSPAIAVDYFGAAFFKPEQLKDLLKIKEQLVSLNLDKMPVTDNDLQTIGQLTALRKLNLSFSKITNDGLSALKGLTHLREIVLGNTDIRKEGLEKILPIKGLQTIYVWNTGISHEDAVQLRKQYASIDIEMGMRTDTMFIKLNPPIIQNEAKVIDSPTKLRLKHFVPGIKIRYTIDGSDPDSSLSQIYDSNSVISKQCLVKAKAFKPGWQSSDIVQYQFFQATYRPDTIIMMKPPDSNYMGKGGKTLKDLVNGTLNYGDGKWLAFRKNNMECLLVFPKSVIPETITINSLTDVGSKIFPPKKILIYGGEEKNNLKLLYQSTPQKDTMQRPSYLIPYDCKIKPTKARFIKIVVEPFGQLPKQPNEKKPEYGWFFTDEIFVN